MDVDESIKHEPLKKKMVFGFKPVHERTKFEAPPPPPPKDQYPRKPKYWQLRGTIAQKYRHRYALTFTLGACVIGAYLMKYYDDKRVRFLKLVGGRDHFTFDETEEVYIARRNHVVAEFHGFKPGKTDQDPEWYRKQYHLEKQVKGSGSTGREKLFGHFQQDYAP